jgi:hypothetical protein
MVQSKNAYYQLGDTELDVNRMNRVILLRCVVHKGISRHHRPSSLCSSLALILLCLSVAVAHEEQFVFPMSDECSKKKLPLQHSERVFVSETFNKNSPSSNSLPVPT